MSQNPQLPLESYAVPDTIPTANILGVRVHSVSVPEMLKLMKDAIIQRKRLIVSYVNVHGMNLSYKNPRFRERLNAAEITFCDGVGLRVGAKLLGQALDHRNTPPDWIEDMARMCAENDFSIYLIGSKPGISEKAAEKLKETIPGLHIVGTYHGYFDKTSGSADNAEVIKKINDANPDLVVIGYGMPLQEFWLEESGDALTAPVLFPVGAALDYVAGETYRAPRWITDNGLEWLARLVVEPRRLWRRYVIGNPLFIFRVLRQRFTGFAHPGM
jgi:N-acetylglucosaminyldiphosphoundecaprenol N-acetyl-beta-D-mannosaminyltransferase